MESRFGASIKDGAQIWLSFPPPLWAEELSSSPRDRKVEKAFCNACHLDITQMYIFVLIYDLVFFMYSDPDFVKIGWPSKDFYVTLLEDKWKSVHK